MLHNQCLFKPAVALRRGTFTAQKVIGMKTPQKSQQTDCSQEFLQFKMELKYVQYLHFLLHVTVHSTQYSLYSKL